MNTFDKEKLESYFNKETGKEDAGFVEEIFTDENRKSSLQSFLSHQWNSFLEFTDIPGKDFSPLLHKIHFRINMAQSLKEKRLLRRMRYFQKNSD